MIDTDIIIQKITMHMFCDLLRSICCHISNLSNLTRAGLITCRLEHITKDNCLAGKYGKY